MNVTPSTAAIAAAIAGTLTARQRQSLLMIRRAGSLSRIGRDHWRTKSWISRAIGDLTIERLQSAGLIYRTPAPANGCVERIYATALGAEVARQIDRGGA